MMNGAFMCMGEPKQKIDGVRKENTVWHKSGVEEDPTLYEESEGLAELRSLPAEITETTGRGGMEKSIHLGVQCGDRSS